MSPEVVLIALAALAVYGLICYLAPFRHCHHCRGMGRIRSRFGRVRPCRWCDTTGRKLRAGRHLINYLIVIRRSAATAERARAHRATAPARRPGEKSS